MTAAQQRRTHIDSQAPSGASAGRDQPVPYEEVHAGTAMPAFEWILPVFYPILLLIGSTYSAISPDMRRSQGLSVPAPSYFARKSNFLNVYFVKVGWAWTILAFVLFVFLRPVTSSSQPALAQRRLQAMTRLGVLTMWWIAVSQWFFGPALMERSFRLSGGACDLPSWETSEQPVRNSVEIVTEGRCRLLGGTWKGGYDISGHVFLLVLSSAALLLEARPFLTPNGDTAREVPSESMKTRVSVDRNESESWTVELVVLTIVTVLDIWMLLMTAIYFHTFSEKVAGLLVSYAGLAVVYYLPRFSQPVYNILSRPGH